MSKCEVTAAKDFRLALSCREQVEVKKDEVVEVNFSSIRGMVDAGQIVQPKGKKFDEMLDVAMTTKGAETSGSIMLRMSDGTDVTIGDATKDQLETYAREYFVVELDKRKSLASLRKQVLELLGTGRVSDADNADDTNDTEEETE